METKARLKSFSLSLAKFATSSVLATVVDFVLFLFVLSPVLKPFWAEFFSGFVGMVINFFLQKRFVFTLRRNAYAAFGLSILFSLIALLLGSYLMQFLVSFDFFKEYLVIAKVMVVASKFFFNYFTKKRIFEKRKSFLDKN